MYVMDRAAKWPAQGQPFRDPTFATSDSNRARWQGESYGLAVDWLYPVLTSKDKATIRKVFLRWCQEIVTGAYHAPQPVAVVNDPRLLFDKLDLRWAANNHASALGQPGAGRLWRRARYRRVRTAVSSRQAAGSVRAGPRRRSHGGCAATRTLTLRDGELMGNTREPERPRPAPARHRSRRGDTFRRTSS
ncbi:MAG TPA: hypothetical protein VJQ08_03555 [Candidatus Dormibacteraeota bacterium]|nr:hypothetical protein [Candidatus Dormibacteraeota bacterium]